MCVRVCVCVCVWCAGETLCGVLSGPRWSSRVTLVPGTPLDAGLDLLERRVPDVRPVHSKHEVLLLNELSRVTRTASTDASRSYVAFPSPPKRANSGFLACKGGWSKSWCVGASALGAPRKCTLLQCCADPRLQDHRFPHHGFKRRTLAGTVLPFRLHSRCVVNCLSVKDRKLRTHRLLHCQTHKGPGDGQGTCISCRFR